MERFSCFPDKELRLCFSFKLVSGETPSLKPGSTLFNQIAGSVGQEITSLDAGTSPIWCAEDSLVPFASCGVQITARPHLGLFEASGRIAQPGNLNS